jgi:hypothetical protein
MPALYPSARLANLKRSFDVFVDATLGPSFPGRINWAGIPYDESGPYEWIEPWLMGPARDDTGYGREIESRVVGQIVTYMPQINIFVRPSKLPEEIATLHRLQLLRDIVAEELSPRRLIAIKDYGGDLSTVGYFILDRINLDQEIPLGSVEDLRQWSYSINARWIEEVSTLP